ncbi:LytTR family transcriptional regulator [Lactobacillus sp. XV13L]|nr:LytTR family transcriptional regulator [Lactobacillus sp. XV13L]
MKINFQNDSSLDEGDIQIEIRAQHKNVTVRRLIGWLEKLAQKEPQLIPVKTSDRIVVVKRAELIKIEVQTTNLTYYTTTKNIKTIGRLYQAQEKLGNDFIQVSRHAVINLNHLESVEVGFDGNMIAILTNDLKVDVSRHYFPLLERALGL